MASSQARKVGCHSKDPQCDRCLFAFYPDCEVTPVPGLLQLTMWRLRSNVGVPCVAVSYISSPSPLLGKWLEHIVRR